MVRHAKRRTSIEQRDRWRHAASGRMVHGVTLPLTDLRRTAIASERLALNAFELADAGAVFAAIDRTLARFMVWEPPTSLAAFQSTGADWVARMERGTDLPLLIRLASSREFLGMATLQQMDTAEPSLGIWLREGAHGKGYGREAGLAILGWVGETRGAALLHYPVVAGDIPSKRLAEALGGQKGGSHSLRKASGIELKVLEYRIDTALAIPAPAGPRNACGTQVEFVSQSKALATPLRTRTKSVLSPPRDAVALLG